MNIQDNRQNGVYLLHPPELREISSIAMSPSYDEPLIPSIVILKKIDQSFTIIHR